MALPERRVLLRLHSSGLSLSAIARKCGVSRQAVHAKLGGAKHRAVPSNAKLTDAKVREARRLRAKGWTMPRLMKRYGVSKSTMESAVSGRTWAHVDEPIPGPVKTRPAQAKLTPAKVRKARELFAKGVRQAELARRYGVTPKTMEAVLRKETWRDVE